MTVSNTPRKAGPFTGNDAQTAFPFAFKVFTKNDIALVLADLNGIETTLVLDSDYSVELNADQDNNPGGTATMFVPPPTGYKLAIIGALDYTQTMDLTNGGGFYPQVQENAADRTVIEVQQLVEQLSRAVQVPVTSDVDPADLLQQLEVDAAEASAAAAAATAAWNAFQGQYYGAYASDPSTDPLGNPPNAGDLYWNSTTGHLRVYDATSAVWLEQPSASLITPHLFSGDGVTTDFALTRSPVMPQNALVFIGGAYQRPTTDYTIIGSLKLTLHFVTAPVAGANNVECLVMSVLPISSVDASNVLTADGGNVQDALDSEEARATAAETALGVNITNETTRATTAESGLQTQVTANNALAVHLAGAETITGLKAFSVLPQSGVGPTVASDFVNKAYADAIAAGFHQAALGPVQAATTAALAANTYNNGTAGVGATITINANGAFPAQDTVTLTVGQSLWVKNEATQANNGIYTLTTVGTGGTQAVLTRRTDANTPALLSNILAYVNGGATLGGNTYTIPQTGITVGTTALTPVIFSGSSNAAYATLAARLNAPFFIPGANATLANITALQLFGTNKSLYYYVSNFFYHDVGSRYTFEVSSATNSAGAGATVVANVSIGSGTAYTGPTESTLNSVGGSGVTGTVEVDFSVAPSAFSFYSGTPTTGGINASCQIDTTAWQNRVTALANTAITAAAASAVPASGAFIPFADNISNNFLRSVVRGVYLYGAIPSHQYIVSLLSIFSTSVSMTIRDLNIPGTNTGLAASIGAAGSGGTNGTFALPIAAPSAGGVQAVGTFTVAGGIITAVNLSAAGSNYVSTLTINNAALAALSAGLTGASITLTQGGGAIGQPVCQLGYLGSSLPGGTALFGPGGTNIPAVWKMYQGTIGGTKTNLYAVVNFNWLAAVAGSYVYTTAVQGGLHSSVTYSADQVQDYQTLDVFQEVITVGQTAGAQIQTANLNTALSALYDCFNTNAAFLGIARCHYRYQILLDLIDDSGDSVIDEFGNPIVPLGSLGTYAAVKGDIPEYVTIRGRGKNRTLIYSGDYGGVQQQLPPLDAPFEFKLMDCSVLSLTGDGGAWIGNYCIHSDNNNGTAGAFYSQPNRKLVQVLRRAQLIGGPLQATWCFGHGISSGQTTFFDDVQMWHQNPATTFATLGCHNTANSILPSTIILKDTSSLDTNGSINILSLGAGTKSRLILNNSEFASIGGGISGVKASTNFAADLFEWRIEGVYDGPVNMSDVNSSTSSLIVLQTTPGVTVSGSAAPVIFGSQQPISTNYVDVNGRGDLWIQNGTAKSLGARLGDCTSVNLSLTIGAQTFTFNANYTAMTNSAIEALINAVITTNPVSEFDIQNTLYPSTGYQRWVLNSTGADIPAGYFVSASNVANNTVVLANGAADIMGFTLDIIRNGQLGKIVTAKRVNAQYVSGAAGVNGPFGVVNGLFTSGGSPAKGFVSKFIGGSQLTLY